MTMKFKLVTFSLCMVSLSAVAGGFSTNPILDVDFSSVRQLDKNVWARTVGVTANTSVFYTDGDQNVTHESSDLVLEARREHINNPKYGDEKFQALKKIESRDVSSASIATVEYFTYGKFEIVAEVPDSAGLQPAIWLQGKNQGQYGEIDIMEAKGDKNVGVRYATIHAGSSVKSLQRKSAYSQLGPGFHKYTAEWTPNSIKILHDDKLILVADSDLAEAENCSPLKQPMQLKINLGGGSRWVGPIDLNALPQQMKIRSVKIWSYVPD